MLKKKYWRSTKVADVQLLHRSVQFRVAISSTCKDTHGNELLIAAVAVGLSLHPLCSFPCHDLSTRSAEFICGRAEPREHLDRRGHVCARLYDNASWGQLCLKLSVVSHGLCQFYCSICVHQIKNELPCSFYFLDSVLLLCNCMSSYRKVHIYDSLCPMTFHFGPAYVVTDVIYAKKQHRCHIFCVAISSTWK